MAKNCNNCRHLYEENDGDEYTPIRYFVCGKRCDGDFDELYENLARPEYRNKGKVCFEAKPSSPDL